MCNNSNLVFAFFGVQDITKYNSREATAGATWFLFSSQRAYWPNQQAKSSNRIWCTFIICLTNAVHQINHAVGGPWMSQLFLLHLDNVVHGIVETLMLIYIQTESIVQLSHIFKVLWGEDCDNFNWRNKYYNVSKTFIIFVFTSCLQIYVFLFS